MKNPVFPLSVSPRKCLRITWSEKLLLGRTAKVLGAGGNCNDNRIWRSFFCHVTADHALISYSYVLVVGMEWAGGEHALQLSPRKFECQPGSDGQATGMLTT